MIAGGNWWRANEIVIRHLTRQTATRYCCCDRAHTLSGHTAGVDECLDLRFCERSHPGDLNRSGFAGGHIV
jgi:hypothetical protein